MRTTGARNTTDEDQPRGSGIPPAGSHRRRRTMGLCAHCRRPVEFDQEHLRLYRMFWHVDCALAAHEPAPDRD